MFEKNNGMFYQEGWRILAIGLSVLILGWLGLVTTQ